MDPVEPLGRPARDLLGEYRRARPGPHARARNWPAVTRRIDAGATREPWPRVRTSLWLGGAALALAAAILLLAHGMFVAWQAVQSERAAIPQAPAVAPAPTAVPIVAPVDRPAAPVAPAIVVPPSDPPAPVAVQRPRVAEPTAPVAATVDEEIELVAAARDAVRAEDWPAALAQLAAHAERFPNGVLAEERAALHVIASCRSGAAGAREAVRRFDSRYPGSHHHRAIHHACASSLDAPAP